MRRENTYVAYQTDRKAQSRFQAARSILKALRANEQIGNFEYSDAERRQLLREELAHHIPLEHLDVVIEGLLNVEKGEFRSSKLTVTHQGASGWQELHSSLAPLGDKRIQQRPSIGDLSIALKSIIRILTGK